MRDDMRDGGYHSRKFVLAIISLLLISGFATLGIIYPMIESLFPTFVSGILGVIGIYYGGNVVNKYVVGKNQVAAQPIDEIITTAGNADEEAEA